MRRPNLAQSRDDAQRWREALLDTLSGLPDVPLLLSGGMDSLSILAGLVTLGRKPVCVTYRMADTHSLDMAVAIRITRDLDVPHHRLLMSEDPAELRERAKEAVALVGPRKVRVECAVPMLLMCGFVRELGSDRALVGDPGIIEDVRAYQVAVNGTGGIDTPEMRELRLRGYGDIGPGSAAMREAGKARGVELIGPYSRDPIMSLGLSLDPYRINYPRQKGIALRAFPDVFGDGRLTTPSGYRYWKPNSSMQTTSGYADRVREAFGVDSPKRMAAMYARL